MREARLARPRPRPAADDRRRRGRVVRRPERRFGDQRPPGTNEPGDGMDPRHLERLVRRERRQDRRGAGGRASSCPSPAGREEQVVPLRRRRSRAPGGRAPGRGRRRGRVRRRRRRLRSPAARRAAARLRRAGRRPPRPGDGAGRLDARQLGLGRRLGSAEEAREPRPARALRRREDPADRPHATVECELAERRVARERRCGICRDAARMASAIGRSKPEPSLRRPAGARLTVIRRTGHSSSADAMPTRTRSFASWQARSARPTIAKPGTPSCRCASTSTRRASRPTSACVTVRASTVRR